MFCVYLENRSVRNFSLDIFIRMFIDPPYLPNFMSLTLLILLFVSWNELTVSREEVHTMRKHTPSLNSLDMRHNPWSKKEGLRVRVIGRLVVKNEELQFRGIGLRVSVIGRLQKGVSHNISIKEIDKLYC